MASGIGGNIPERVVLVLGMFDGLHLGHREILTAARRIADENDAKIVATTFSDRIAATGIKSNGLLYDERGRVRLLKTYGADFTEVLPADKRFLNQSPTAFLKRLQRRFALIAVVMGIDFKFGKNGAGDAELAARYLKEYGVKTIALPLKLANGRKISTSEIKTDLLNGKIEAANALMGHAYQIEGLVETGRQDGAKNGVPTANIAANPLLTPIGAGVYSTLTTVGKDEYRSVTNVGAHPTFGDMNYNIETYLLDFVGDLYGKEIEVRFLKRLRGIKKFETEAALYEQIRLDVEEVRK